MSVVHGIRLTWGYKNAPPEFGATYCGKDFVVSERMKLYTKESDKVTCKNCKKAKEFAA